MTISQLNEALRNQPDVDFPDNTFPVYFNTNEQQMDVEDLIVLNEMYD